MHSLAHLLVVVSLFSPDTPLDGTARITGNAVSAYNGRPLPGVMISVSEAQKAVVTDSQGRFTLTGLPAGRQKVRISYDGRDTGEYEFALREGRTMQLAVVLDVKAENLAPIVVEARFADIWRDLAGFYERRRQYSGYARFFTREDIDRDHPTALSSLLKGAGIFTWCVYSCMPTRFSRGRICTVPISVNGLPVWERDFDRIPIDNVAGVEIYRDPMNSSPFGQPLIGQYGFEGRDPVYGRSSCGAVGIWTR
ncbi:MAG TPA: carboxypeptidase-like regulatory domain-containing protein [Gemmatimonadales bacterium]|jgi:hypothetical protein|nr:carboxypeptidase-like regulatory domain-containing protein [Gemmatimonadales bacterium]